jgi:hypothetical protein
MAEDKELAKLSITKSLKFVVDQKPFEDNPNSNEPFSDEVDKFF